MYYGKIWTNFDEITGSSHGENERTQVYREHPVWAVLDGSEVSPISPIQIHSTLISACLKGEYEDYRGNKTCGYLTPFKASRTEMTGDIDGHDGWQWDGGYSSSNAVSGEYDTEGASQAIRELASTCANPVAAASSGYYGSTGYYGSKLCGTGSAWRQHQHCAERIASECAKIGNGSIPLSAVRYQILK